MTMPGFVIVALALVTVACGWRLLQLARAETATPPSVKTRWALLFLMQPAMAALLYFALFPPDRSSEPGTLVVLTAGATPAQLSAHRDAAHVVALPEASALAGAQRVPDLATALRKYPDSTRLQVLGAGLPARDRAAARGLPLAFDATPLPRGLVELWPPAQVRAGARWQASGRVENVPGGFVELRDPGGARMERVALDKDGRFVLRGEARGAGRTSFRLRLLDSNQASVEEIELPLAIIEGTAQRVLVLAGGPDPELKYLRRWALDAGLSLHTQISLGAGVQIGDGGVAMDAASLREWDLVVLDERAWRGLGAGRRAALLEALRAGLGVLLRITGPLSEGERAELRALGFAVAEVDLAQSVSLPASAFAATDSANTGITTSEAPPSEGKGIVLTRRPLRVAASDAVELLHDGNNVPLALWRGVGQGRVALWWLSDSHRLVLAGQPAAHGQLWSEAFGTLARARKDRQPVLIDSDPRPQQRLTLCGVSDKASVVALDGQRSPLLVDPASGRAACAGYWPVSAGWFVVHDGETSWPFHVRADDEARGLVAQSLREATRQLAMTAAMAPVRDPIRIPGTPWPWFLAWLLTASLSWWLERRLLRGH